ncbi:hypothetical protein [Sphingomonas echinoides]|uniref:hypothetical protein n=1 Tax=Sphingomonas echinoides TaxID=59803 RepID=UPI0024130A49|nr:hypothetical protein [Sphingomonas echinoides]
MIVSVLLGFLATTAQSSAPPPQACRTIADSAARLACYDGQERAEPAARPAAPLASAPAAVPDAAPLAAIPPAPVPVAALPASTSSADIIRDTPTGRIATVTRQRYGLYRLTLDDGRTFDTATDRATPPAAGTAVRLRRSVIGTTFLDAPGQSPITVRLVRTPR